MPRHLFLQGDIGIGKSSLIKKALLPHLDKVGGFFVQRIFVADHNVAFKMVPVSTANDYKLSIFVDSLDGQDNLFLHCNSDNKWQMNLQVFEDHGLACLRQCSDVHKKLVVMDELGGIELRCPAFMDAVLEVLDGVTPVLGVLKLPRSLDKLKKELAANSKNGIAGDYYYKALKRHPRVDLLTVNVQNYDQARARVEAFVEDIFR